MHVICGISIWSGCSLSYAAPENRRRSARRLSLGSACITMSNLEFARGQLNLCMYICKYQYGCMVEISAWWTKKNLAARVRRVKRLSISEGSHTDPQVPHLTVFDVNLILCRVLFWQMTNAALLTRRQNLAKRKSYSCTLIMSAIVECIILLHLSSSIILAALASCFQYDLHS